MSTTSRRKSFSVIEELANAPYRFSFFQTVRLLERSAVLANLDGKTKYVKNPVARYTPPETEVIRFHTQQSLSFPSSENARIKLKAQKGNAQQWHLFVNFMGLTGSSGVLPFHYSELILKRLKMKDSSLSRFLDLFNHRTISLFYQAATKYNLPVEYERKKLNPPVKNKRDPHTQALLSLLGLGTEHLSNRLYTSDESLLYYSGLFTQRIKTSSGLKQILEHHFGIPVEISEFNGQWQELIDDVRTRLPGREVPKGQNNCLGRSLMLGRKGWFAQGKIRIILGPLNKDQLNTFAPGTKALMALDEIVRFYVDMEYDYDFTIRVKRSDVPAKIRLDSSHPPVIGWNTWLSTKKQYFAADETTDISVSANRFR
ncbi:MAG: type VI secretion system baseplate subunit TssG [Gammaproteobacteria bacterium]|nr:type VI secretion system baseplate subunit TssG [Gammaproteobacteria bacterium]MDH5652760.1 type VI secretion system baseplate subunit TssG [Gammaproteobacteria bacterium]